MRTIDSEQSLGLYAVGWVVCLAFIALMLFGLITTFKQAPLIAVPFFGVFLLIAGKVALVLGGKTGAYLNFGKLRLELQGESPAAGGELKGVLRFAGTAAPSRIDAELVCTREMAGRNMRGNPVTHKVVVLSQKSDLAMQRDLQGRFVEVRIAIPATANPSGEGERPEDPKNPPSYAWALRLTAPDPGGGLERTFPLQVLSAQARGAMPVPGRSGAVAAAVLVAANLVPLALVLWGGASVGGLVALYWAENVVIGFYTVLRMVMAGRDTTVEKIGSVLFFSAHYGIFCLVHGMFVMAMFQDRKLGMARQGGEDWPFPFALVQRLWIGAEAMGLFSAGMLLLPLAALFVSHGVSFVQNYLLNGRYLRAKAGDSFWRPYPRMVLLHVLIIAGGFFIVRHGSPLPMLVGLVAGKTLIDLLLHWRANRSR